MNPDLPHVDFSLLESIGVERLVPALQWLKARAHRKYGLAMQALSASPGPEDGPAHVAHQLEQLLRRVG